MTQDLDANMATTIAQQWLNDSARTATNKEFEAHFNLISKRVKVTGVEGFESVSYEDWARQSEQEFKDGVLESVSYKGLKIQATNDYQIMFKTVELVVANDGMCKSHGVEILLEREEDTIWRAKQQRVLSDAEARHDGLM
jgi:hypothetical protein